jgi:hypothetical protein
VKHILPVALATPLLASCLVSSDDPDARFSRVRVEPMGPSQFMLSCVDSPQICAQEANRLCAAYDVVSNTTNPADFGRMTMIIKCHDTSIPPQHN